MADAAAQRENFLHRSHLLSFVDFAAKIVVCSTLVLVGVLVVIVLRAVVAA
jgi:hypothetical protein